MDVRIVRPKKVLEDYVTGVLYLFLKSWIVMLLVPIALPSISVGYWQAFALSIVVSFLFNNLNYLNWTKEAK